MILEALLGDPRVHARPSRRHVRAGELLIIEALSARLCPKYAICVTMDRQ
jgi:hypothetical protein